MNELIDANDSNFNQFLSDQKAIIVDFWAPSCMPCKLLEPELKKIAANYNSRVKIIKINVNESPRTSSKYMIRGLPTLLFIRDGSVKSQLIGAVKPNEIEQKLREVI
ncbi:MAG: thioredoxin [Candidatus Aminicenantes bacterium]|nr:thioredoxin [Candidatus Aminicenantes bacterium]